MIAINNPSDPRPDGVDDGGELDLLSEEGGGSCGSGGSCGCAATAEADQAPKVVQLNVQSIKAQRSRPEVKLDPFEGTKAFPQGLMIGLDVGSTTVKAVVVDITTDEILWKDYQRHDTKQPEKTLEFLSEIEAKFPEVPRRAFRLFMTGSGGSAIL